MATDVSIETLRSRLSGQLILPSDSDYDSARRVWNALADRHPLAIACCSSADDVVACIDFARSHDLLVAVRGGGHNVAGSAVCDDGLVIDLSAMRGVEIDSERRRARAQGGARWGDFDRATQAHGLATTGGEVSTTGIAGLTLGGGFGWLMGKHGLSCDSLRRVEMVTADGRRVVADGEQHSDLFWGVRGGGGNFGIVTTFEYEIHPLGALLAGPVFYPITEAKRFLQLYQECTAAAPDELTMMALLVVDPNGEPAVGAIVAHCGDPAAGERLVRPLRAFATPSNDQIRLMSYVDLQSMLDATVPAGRFNYWKAHYVERFSSASFDALLEATLPFMSPYSSVLIEHLHGAAARVGSEATAFGLRREIYSLGAFSVWTDASQTARHIEWAKQVSAAMTPFATGAVYVNYLGNEEQPRVRAAYGRNYERLLALKRKYDPTNFFRMNQNIVP